MRVVPGDKSNSRAITLFDFPNSANKAHRVLLRKNGVYYPFQPFSDDIVDHLFAFNDIAHRVKELIERVVKIQTETLPDIDAACSHLARFDEKSAEDCSRDFPPRWTSMHD